MIADIDIENSQTRKVVTLTVPLIKFNGKEECVFDISNLNEEEKKILIDAVDKRLEFTEIELFFVDDDNIPNFGPDFDFTIDENKLYGFYNRKERDIKRR